LPLPPHQSEYFAKEKYRIQVSLFKECTTWCQTGFIHSFCKADKATAASNLIQKSKTPTTLIKAISYLKNFKKQWWCILRI